MISAAIACLAFGQSLTDGLGVPISSPLPLNTNAAGDLGTDHLPRVACDGAGHCVAVWDSNTNLNGSIGTDYDILVSRSVDYGVTWSAPAALNTTASSDGSANDTVPFICTDGLGPNATWICVWESRYNLNGAGTDADIFISRSTDHGATWSAPVPLNTNAATDSGADYDPQIATDGKGNWLAIWRSLDTLQSSIGPDADILYSRSTSNGAPGSWTAPLPLNSNAVGDSGHDIKPRLATDMAGRWIAVWESSDSLGGTIGSDYDVLYGRADWTGGPSVTWSAPAPLNSTASADSSSIHDTDAAIVTDQMGNWLVAWSSNNTLGGTIGTDRDILFSCSVENGSAGTWSIAAALNANAAIDAGDDLTPCLATNRTGAWIAVWSSTSNINGVIGSDADVLLARCDNVGGETNWGTVTVGNTNAASDSGADEWPCVFADDSGAWLFVWQTTDNFGNTIGTEGDLLIARFALPDCNQNTFPDSAEVDCNKNGIPDDCDIANQTSPDANSNGVPDECDDPLCPADCAPPSGDGIVNVNDLLFVINNWGPKGAGTPADFIPPGGDGTVNVNDLLGVINAWGPCP